MANKILFFFFLLLKKSKYIITFKVKTSLGNMGHVYASHIIASTLGLARHFKSNLICGDQLGWINF